MTRKSWLLYFNCLPGVFLLVFCGSSSRCRGLVLQCVIVIYSDDAHFLLDTLGEDKMTYFSSILTGTLSECRTGWIQLIGKDADQTARMHNLVCAYVVYMNQNQIFSEGGLNVAIDIIVQLYRTKCTRTSARNFMQIATWPQS